MPKIEKALPRYPNIYKVFQREGSNKESPTGIYRVRKRVKVNGKWTTRVSSFDNLSDAKKFSKAFVFEEANDTVDSMGFEELLERFFHHKEFEEELAPGTVQGYKNRATHFKFFNGMKLRDITSKVLDLWVDLLLDPQYKALQQSTRKSYDHEFVLLGVLLRHYREFHDETFNIPIMKRHRKRLCGSKKLQMEIRYLSLKEENIFLEALKRWPMMHDLALLQLHTGMRIGEAAAVDFKAIDFINNLVHIRQHMYWDRTSVEKSCIMQGTKTGPDRTVPLTIECREMLKARREFSLGTLVFEDAKTKTWLEYRKIQSCYDSAFRASKLPHRGTHTLRHTFAVRFLEQTKDIYALQKALGHTDLKTTLVYAKYTNDSVKRAFQVFRGGASDNHHVPQLVPKI